ncbi:MAG TPA: phosphodiester glycosidase family protein [Candidatus Obscuribacterales bacterium]
MKKQAIRALILLLVLAGLVLCITLFVANARFRAICIERADYTLSIASSIIDARQRFPEDTHEITSMREEHSANTPAPLFFIPNPIQNVHLPPIPFFSPSKPRKEFKVTRGTGKPVKFCKRALHGVPFYITEIDLNDPETFLTIGLANNAQRANSTTVHNGDEPFDALLKRNPGAVVVNGTFFSKDQEKRVMGNMVSEGRVLKYSEWENFGTTFGIKADNELEMITAREEGQPRWEDHWFSLTCGPRLLMHGEIWIEPVKEGFTDSHVLTVGPRSAIGFAEKGKKIYLVSFLHGLSLEGEAKLMKEIGCYEAMNLDGGASKALAYNGSVIIKAGRPLTNVLVVYDTTHPAPDSVVHSWLRFQNGERPQMASRSWQSIFGFGRN